MVHLFGIGVTGQDVTDTKRTFVETDLNIELYTTTDGTLTAVPISQYYGLQSLLHISQ